MIRDLERLASEAFDVLVIGGGIYGLAIARELTARGLTSALIERGDFGGATSFNSLKTVHGGIRALQHGALLAMREFVRERRGLASIAPHLIRALPFVVPTFRHPVRNRPLMAAFLAAYDLLAADRNNGVDRRLSLPRSRTVSREECLRLSPLIDPTGVTGGAVWHDYQLHSPERLAVALLDTAVRNGAAGANYIEARGFVQHGREIRGVRVHDALGGGDFELRCRFVVNAAGPWAWPLLQKVGAAPTSAVAPAMSLALNIVIDRASSSHAAGGLADGRFLFLVPWRDRSIIGTSHDPFDGHPDAVSLTDTHVDGFLRDTAKAFPRANVTRADVRLVHRGLLPATRRNELLKQSIIHDHQCDGLDGIVTVVGVRYTTARATAAAAAEHVATRLGRPSGTCAPTRQPVTGGGIPDLDHYEQDQLRDSPLPPPLVCRLIATYGSSYDSIVRLLRDAPALAAPLSATCHVTSAEIVHAVRQEMAMHLTDALLRRTEAGTAGHPGDDAVRAAAGVMAVELRWTPSKVADEIDAVDAAYPGVRS